MPVTSSSRLGFPIPSAISQSKRLEDIQAVKAALVAIDNSVAPLSMKQNVQSDNYTCVLTDSGKHIFHPSSDTTARTFTIPSNASVAYELGTSLTFVNHNGAGNVSISIDTDTLRLAGTGSTNVLTLAPNGIATALKVSPTEWIIAGTGLS